MKARKILAVSLTAAMTLALAACGGSSSDKESSSKDSSDKVYKIGICQQRNRISDCWKRVENFILWK